MLLTFALLVATAGPDPYLARFKASRPPVTVDEKSTGGTELTAAEVKAHRPAKQVPGLDGWLAEDPTRRVFAGPRVDFKGFSAVLVRFERRSEAQGEVAHFLFTLRKDGKVLDGALVASAQLVEFHLDTGSASIAADQTLLLREVGFHQLEEVPDEGSMTESERRGTISPDGTLVVNDAAFTKNTGRFTDGTSKESLALIPEGAGLRGFYWKEGKPAKPVTVTGTATDRKLTLRFKDGKPYTLAFDEARTGFVCTNPDGTTQRFER